MTNRTVCCCAFLASVLGVPGAARAQLTGSDGFVRLALQANRELSAARLDLERGRARLRQAGLRPNPTIDIENTTGRLTGSPQERELSVGVALPLELGRQRQRRLNVAEAELAITEAEILDRERLLRRDVLIAYATALSAQRELQVTDNIRELDLQTTSVVRTRVSEGDTPPLELNLLTFESERVRSRRALVQGRLEAAVVALQAAIGLPPGDPLSLGDELSVPALATRGLAPVDAAIQQALERRPDLRAARLSEAAAMAGLSLARAQAFPEVTVSGRAIQSHSIQELPNPLVPVGQTDRLLAFGVSIGLPVFNANQGARAEAEVAIRQAATRRQFVEQQVRAEVIAAYRRAQASAEAIAIFEQGVLQRSSDNLRILRAAYELGEFRITDLIAEQRRVLDAQQEYTEALVERFRAAAELDAAIGNETSVQP